MREYKRKWRENNWEKVKAQRERDQVRKKARLEGDEERLRKTQEKARKQKQRYRQANPEKVREQQRKWRQAHPEKVREHERKRQQVHREKRRERKQRWRKNNPEKVKAQRERERARKKARQEADEERRRVVREKVRQEGDEERMRTVKEKVRERKQRYREVNREKLREQKRRWRKNNPEKVKAQRERERAQKDGDEESRRKRREWLRWYHEAHKEKRNQAKRERYARQQGRPVPPPPSPPVAPPCDCGVCLACGGWGVSWKPAWHARLNAFCTKNDPPTPAVRLEELPLDLLESETETLSIASTSEIDSEFGDRLDALLADESDSEGETVDKVEVPTRRSRRIATMPSVSYQDWEEEENPMLELLRRKAQLHAEAEDRIVTRWEMLQHRTERVDAIVEEMSMGVDPTRQLDRFHSQLERQDGVLDVMVREDLLDFVDDQLLLL